MTVRLWSLVCENQKSSHFMKSSCFWDLLTNPLSLLYYNLFLNIYIYKYRSKCLYINNLILLNVSCFEALKIQWLPWIDLLFTLFVLYIDVLFLYNAIRTQDQWLLRRILLLLQKKCRKWMKLRIKFVYFVWCIKSMILTLQCLLYMLVFQQVIVVTFRRYFSFAWDQDTVIYISVIAYTITIFVCFWFFFLSCF